MVKIRYKAQILSVIFALAFVGLLLVLHHYFPYQEPLPSNSTMPSWLR